MVKTPTPNGIHGLEPTGTSGAEFPNAGAFL